MVNFTFTLHPVIDSLKAKLYWRIFTWKYRPSCL